MGPRRAAASPGPAGDRWGPNLVRVTAVDSERRPDYPPAERLDLVERLHGRALADPYRWLEDPADPRTQAPGRGRRTSWPGRTWTRCPGGNGSPGD